MDLTLCVLGNLSCVLCRLLIFSKSFSRKKNQEYNQSLDPDQAFVGPDLGPNCLHTRKVYTHINKELSRHGFRKGEL